MALISIGVVLLFIASCIFIFSVSSSSATLDDPSGMLGLEGVAQDNFTSSGLVLVRGELWRATSSHGIVPRGARVRVVEVGPGLSVVVEHVVD